MSALGGDEPTYTVEWTERAGRRVDPGVGRDALRRRVPSMLADINKGVIRDTRITNRFGVDVTYDFLGGL